MIPNPDNEAAASSRIFLPPDRREAAIDKTVPGGKVRVARVAEINGSKVKTSVAARAAATTIVMNGLSLMNCGIFMNGPFRVPYYILLPQGFNPDACARTGADVTWLHDEA